ncbi:hypothetical protein Csa_018524 [Cucumis sativus]|nr:hypothetical protein Csa_018524 [Cucumis sativus]
MDARRERKNLEIVLGLTKQKVDGENGLNTDGSGEKWDGSGRHTQGLMTIAEYEKKYKKLYEHATSVIEDEAKDCKRVEEGLREEIRTSVTPCAKWIDFSKLVEAAIRVQINVHERKLESEALKNDLARAVYVIAMVSQVILIEIVCI